MALRTRLIAGSAAVVLGSLLLAGCSGNGEPIDLAETDAPVASSAPSSAADETPSIDATEEAPAEEAPQPPAGSGEVPPIGDAVVSQGASEDGTQEMVIYSGDTASIAALRDSFEGNGFLWNDVNGDGSYIIASSVKSNVTLVDNMDGTYSYTSFKGE